MTHNTVNEGDAQPTHVAGHIPEFFLDHLDQHPALSNSNDAECCGLAAANEQRFTITYGTYGIGNKNAWSRKNFVFDELFDLLSTHTPTKKKDGQCFVAGQFEGGQRLAPNVTQIDLLVYDVDGGSTIKALDERLGEPNMPMSIMYTTYSHETDKTLVKAEGFAKWATTNKMPSLPTQERICEYLAFLKKTVVLDSNPIFDPEADTEHTPEGIFYVVRHDPIHKARIVFLLETPIVLRKLGNSSKTFLNEYKRIYHGVGEALGLDFDVSCSDPSRLHYLPAHPPGATNYSVLFNENGGKLLNWEKYPRADLATAAPEKRETIRDEVSGEEREVRPSDYVVVDRNGHRIDLYKWAKANLATFDLEDLLKQKLPDENLRAERSNGGFHIGCPFEDEHTKHGSNGTFVANGDGEKWAVIHCMHHSCQSQGRITLNFLKELFVQQYLVAEDLFGKENTAYRDVGDLLKDSGANPDLISFPQDEEEDEDEEVEVLDPVFDNPTDLESVKEQAYKLFREARHASHAVAGLTAFFKYKIEDQLSYNDMLENLIQAPITISQMKKFLRACAYHFERANIQWEEVQERFVAARCIETDIMLRANKMVEDELQGAKLKFTQRQAADWFGCPMRNIEEAYRMQSRARHEQEVDKLLVERMGDLSHYAVLTIGDRTVYLDMRETQRTGEPEIRTDKAMQTLFKNATVATYETNKEGGKKEKTYNVFKEWSQRDKTIPIFKGLTFDPNQGAVTKDGKFNQFTKDRWGIRPKEGECTRILNHIRDVWCEGDEKVFNWVIMYLANIFQKPGDKPHSAIALLGAPGTGKSIILEHGLAHMLGNMYGKSAQRRHMTGNFNMHMGGKLLWLAEESLFAGDVEGTNVLKDLIASETLLTEPKNYNAYPVPNHTRFFFTSNSVHALKLEADDRRFLVLKASEKYKQNSEYFSNLRHWMTKESGNNYFLHYLLNWKPEEHGLAWRDLYNPPMTPHKMGQIEMSRDPGEEFFAVLLRNGFVSGACGKVSWPYDPKPSGNAHQVDPVALKSLFNEFVEHQMSHQARYERRKYGQLFEKYLGKKHGDLSQPTQIAGLTKKVRQLKLPPRHVCLEAALAKRLITQEDYDYARDNPYSHLGEREADE